ncbi:MAG: type IV secretion protein IcmD [Gammaproteobacteria bacterium]|nr:type IV secretion protein IcmD [Gammaproteobacteria bacterium]
MKKSRLTKAVVLFAGAMLCLFSCELLWAAAGISGVAKNVTGNLGAVAKLITAGAYVAGFAFVVGGIVKFKAHKDNPTQVMISQPIALLFIGAALIFVPSVFKTTGGTLFGSSGDQATISGVSSFSK